MKKIKIIYKVETFEVNISKEKAYPNSLYKVEFENISKLLEILQSPIYIEEKKESSFVYSYRFENPRSN